MTLSQFIKNNIESNLTYSILRNYMVPDRNQIKDIFSDISGQPEYKYEKIGEYLYSKSETSSGRMSIKDYDIPYNINSFLLECLDAYPESIDTYMLYMIKGYGFSGSPRHQDPTDVIHWQCVGSSNWIIEDDSESIHEIVLNPGDVLWFKKYAFHSVSNSDIKYGVVFNTDKDD